MRLHRASFFAVALLGVACDPAYVPPTWSEDGEPVYHCTGATDAQCDGATPIAMPVDQDPYPEPPIAVGATFHIDKAQAVTPERFAENANGDLIAKSPGVGAILVGHTIMYFEAVRPVALRLSHEGAYMSGNFDQVAGQASFSLRNPDRFRVNPVDANGNVLAGALDCNWSSSNPFVLSVNGDSHDIATIQINLPGHSTLHVEMGGLSQDVPFDVSL